MAYDPKTDPEVLAALKQVQKAQADAHAKADRLMQDDKLARGKGHSSEQIEARKRVAAVFCELHLAHEPPEAVKSRLEKIDYTQVVASTNARGKNVENPSGGFLGLSRKPAYILSLDFPPKSDTEPIYALEYFPLQK